MTFFPPLETERLYLRPISRSDSEFIVQHFLEPSVQQYLYDNEPMTTPEEALAIIDFYVNPIDTTYNRWVLVRKSDQCPLGTCGFHFWNRAHRRAEIGYDLSPAYVGNGYMSEAVQAMLLHGYNKLDLYRIEAQVAVENQRSQALLERLGFQREGLLRANFWSGGQPHDHYLFARLRD